MSGVCLFIILLIMLVYLDFAFWYSSEMHNIWNDKKRKFRGFLFKFWDWLGGRR